MLDFRLSAGSAGVLEIRPAYPDDREVIGKLTPRTVSLPVACQVKYAARHSDITYRGA
jgi:hypothetical protein